MKKKIIIVFGLIVFLLAIAACNTNNEPEETTVEITDREGFTVNIPLEIESIISIGPANTEIIAALGFASQITYTDMFSNDIHGVAAGINVLDMMALDMEFIIDQDPDIVFVTGMTRVGGNDPMGPVVEMGIPVINIPMSATIADIKEDINFIAYVLGVENVGATIIENMNDAIEEIQAIAANISETKTVYFEVSPAEFMVSLGTGTFINEMIELIGAVNIFADHEGWLSVSDEQVLELNPDVIITSVDFVPDPVAEIMSRDGWDSITAVQENAVFQIDANASSRPNHNIITALWAMARAIYPNYFG